MANKQDENFYDLVSILLYCIKERRKRYYEIKITQALCTYKLYCPMCWLGWGRCLWCNCISSVCFVLLPCVLPFCRTACIKTKFFFFNKSFSTSTKFNLQVHKGNYCSLGSQAFQQIPRNVQRKEWLSVLNCGLRGSYFAEYCLKVAI